MATFLGTNGNDVITPGSVSAGVTRIPGGSFPSAASDVLDGDDGNDVLAGGGGGDTLLGGDGNDTISVNASDSVDGGADNDLVGVFGANAATILEGGSGTDTLLASAAVNISSAAVSGFETLALNANALTLTAAQLDQFGSIIAAGPSLSGAIVLSAAGSVNIDVFSLVGLTVTGSSGNDELVFFTPGPVSTPITVNAGFGNDTVFGADGNDNLAGGDGNDFLSGRAGSDVLTGGNGNDTIAVFSADRANGGANDDVFVGSENLAAGTEIIGGAGIDRFIDFSTSVIDPTVLISGVEILALDFGTLTLSGKQLDGFDTITNDSGSATYTIFLTTGGQPEVVASADVTALTQLTVNGTAINDRLTFTASGATPTNLFVDALDGDDSIFTGAGNDTLEGGSGNDTLSGGAGIDRLFGEAGNDVLFIRDQDDAFGGDDNDLFELLENATVPKIFDGGAGNDTLDPSGTRTIAPGVIIQNIENLALDASTLTMTTAQLGSFSTIIADGTAAIGAVALTAGGTASLQVLGLTQLKVSGSGGNEVLSFTTGAGTALILDGDGGDDQITGGIGDDEILGRAGNDTLDGGVGIDSLDGGDGNDVLIIRSDNTADGGAGLDLFQVVSNLLGTEMLDGGSGGADRLDPIGALTFAAGVDIVDIEELALDLAGITLTAETLNRFDRIVAAGPDTGSTVTLSAGGGVNILVEDLATLTIVGSNGSDVLDLGNPLVTAITALLGDGADAISAGALADSLSGGVGNDTLSGRGGDDSLVGGAGIDLLLGGTGSDLLNGGSETDTLVGGGGRDRLTGGSAADFFRWDLPTEGQDTVRDFSSALGDKLQFDASGFGGGLIGGAPLAAGQLVVHASSVSTSPSGVGQFVFNTDTQRLLWDADGSGGARAVKIAKLDGVATLLTSDFDIIA